MVHRQSPRPDVAGGLHAQPPDAASAADSYILTVGKYEHRVTCEPGESSSGLFGGNSNWRGPIWFPVNDLLVESLQKFHHYLGDDFRVECPTGLGKFLTLAKVATELSQRLTRIFLTDQNERRPVLGCPALFQCDPFWNQLVLFHEYFHGDTGAGVGASHRTGWAALVAKLLQQSGEPDGARPDTRHAGQPAAV